MSDDGGEYDSGTFSETSYDGSGGSGGSSGGACCSIPLGFASFFGSFYLLWWNEGRSVDVYEAIQESTEGTKSVGCVPVDSNFDSPVHITCDLTDLMTLRDDYWGGPGNLKGVFLRRSVETYQWVEVTRKETRGETTTTTYDCSVQWSSSVPKTSGFECRVDADKTPMNPSSFPMWAQRKEWNARSLLGDASTPNIKAGGFELTEKLIDQIRSDKDLKVQDFAATGCASTPTMSPTASLTFAPTPTPSNSTNSTIAPTSAPSIAPTAAPTVTHTSTESWMVAPQCATARLGWSSADYLEVTGPKNKRAVSDQNRCNLQYIRIVI